MICYLIPGALNDILPVELQLSITGMTVGPTLGPEHCIIEQESISQLPHSDPSYRRSLLVEVREGERETAQHNNRHKLNQSMLNVDLYFCPQPVPHLLSLQHRQRKEY